jgi:hypothetical protein
VAYAGVAGAGPLPHAVRPEHEGGEHLLVAEGASEDLLAGDAVEERQDDGSRTDDAAGVLHHRRQVVLLHRDEEEVGGLPRLPRGDHGHREPAPVHGQPLGEEPGPPRAAGEDAEEAGVEIVQGRDVQGAHRPRAAQDHPLDPPHRLHASGSGG